MTAGLIVAALDSDRSRQQMNLAPEDGLR